ncbi:MAG TPA: hypothetical protein VMZ69_11550 [Saprospiraceae bacterium]|nr:hypothetical protein [Saprospiraceae bacterium]
MLKLLLFTSLIFPVISHMQSQTLKGEYRLQGVHDAASAFMFSNDGKFEFFFIYGVVDRTATGTYIIDGNILTLKSDKEPGKDFPVTLEKQQGTGYTIKIKHDNSYLLQNVVCQYIIEGKENYATSDSNGEIHIDEKNIDKLLLMHELFPDVPSVIKDASNSNNWFEVGLSPALGEVSFADIKFIVEGKSIRCEPNALLPFQKVDFVKQ